MIQLIKTFFNSFGKTKEEVIWTQIPGFSKYELSNNNQVRSISRKVQTGTKRSVNSKIISPTITAKNVRYCLLSDKGHYQNITLRYLKMVTYNN